MPSAHATRKIRSHHSPPPGPHAPPCHWPDSTQQTARALSSNSLHLRSLQVSLSCVMASCLGTLPKAQFLLLALSFLPSLLQGSRVTPALSRLPTTDPSGLPNSTWFLLTHQSLCPTAWLLWGTPAFPAPSRPSCCLTGSADSPFISVLPKVWHRFPQRAGTEAMNSNCCHHSILIMAENVRVLHISSSTTLKPAL